MQFDKTVLSSFVILLVAVLKIFKIEILPDNLQTTIETIINIVGGLIIYLNGRKVANTNLFGAIKRWVNYGYYYLLSLPFLKVM